jgi:hypothetical protein
MVRAVGPRPGTVAGVAGTGRRIAVLFHERQRDSDAAVYLLDKLAAFWREDGHEVVYLYGTGRFVPADLLLVHVDLSVVPEPYLVFAARYPVVLNGRVRVGGLPERVLGAGRLARRLHLAGRARGVALTWQDYRIFDRLDDVPAEWLARSNLVVERFLPELENGLYHYRMYQFLGDRGRCTRLGSPQPVFKADHSTLVEWVEPHPEAVTWREELGLDYGKIDYLVHDGEAVLLDANKTTGTSTHTDPETLQAERRNQAQGLYAYFSGREPE